MGVTTRPRLLGTQAGKEALHNALLLLYCQKLLGTGPQWWLRPCLTGVTVSVAGPPSRKVGNWATCPCCYAYIVHIVI